MKLTELKQLPNNPRTIKDESFAKLCASISTNPEYFKARPIIVSDRTGENIILAGNQRYAAAKHLKLLDVPVYVLKGLTEKQEREIIIRDNVSNGDWDFDALRADWCRVELAEWDLEIPEFEIIPTDPDDLQDSEAEEANTIETNIVIGDLIEIGKHRLVCGDSTDITVHDKLGSNDADFVFTDPMYQDSCEPIISILNAIDVNYFLIMATFKQCVDFINKSGMRFRFDLVLNQLTPSSSMNKKVPYYLHKNLIYLTKTDDTIFNCDNAKGVFSETGAGYYPSVIEGAKNTSEEHGLAKNSTAIYKVISGFKFKIVLDMFIGSGTTMVAAHQLGRICYGIELSPRYCQVIVNRMKKLDETLEVKVNGQVV